MQHLRELLADHQPPYVILNYIIAKEDHEDGTPHVHVYLQLDQRVSISDPAFLDLWGHHGNYQVVRSSKAVEAYCTKEEDYITNFFQKKYTWGDVLAAETKEDFLDKAAKADARAFVLNKRNIDYYVEQRFGVRPEYTPAYAVNSFRVHEQFLQYVQDELRSFGGRGRPLILESPSRYGKTEYVRTLLHSSNIDYVYLNGLFNADAFPVDLSNVRFIVMDDMTCENFFKFAWKPFWGCQREFVITDKYKSKRTLIFPKKWSLIWLCNPDQNPFNPNQFGVNHDIRTYIRQQNYIQITLERPLFNEE